MPRPRTGPHSKSEESEDLLTKKQVSVWLTREQYLALRREAARRRTAMSTLCMQWVGAGLDQLIAEHESSDAGE